MLFSFRAGVFGTGECRCPDRRTDRQDREERQAETTADVRERSRGTTATGHDLTLSRKGNVQTPAQRPMSAPARAIRWKWPTAQNTAAAARRPPPVTTAADQGWARACPHADRALMRTASNIR